MNVIVYDLPDALGLEYHVPDPWVLQLTVGRSMALADALAEIARDALPTAAANLVFTTDADLPTLSQARNRKAAMLRAACQARICAGFVSAALGSPFHYPSTETDQRNLLAAVVHSLSPTLPADWTTPFWCADASGAWAQRDHSASQIQRVGCDGNNLVIAAQTKLAGLLSLVFAADTVADLQAIEWH
jgi:hypothetical protein